MSNNENNQTPVGDKLAILQNKRLIIIIATVVAVFALAMIPICIHLFSKGGETVVPDNPDTGETISGTYSMNDGSVGYMGSSTYTFEGNKVVNRYSDGTEQKVIEYTYVIAIENGIKVIKLTPVSGTESTEVTTHEFAEGKFGDKPIIMINDVIYYLVEDKSAESGTEE